MATKATGRPRNVTRREVARLAGVSDAVVTYTLTGTAPVAPETARRVRAAVEELGYQPNRAARALRSGSTNALALITLDDSDVIFTNPIFGEYAHEVQLAASASGYALFTASAAQHKDSMLERFREFASRQVDGILLLPPAGPLPDPTDLDAVDVRWVQLNTDRAQPGVDSVGVDLYGGAHAVVTHLVEHGHKPIGFVGAAARTEPRRLAWRDVCADHRVAAGPLLDVDHTREGGYEAALELADSVNPPGAVFVISDRTAMGLLRGFHERGVRVPEDIAVGSFDGSWESAYAWPSLTTARQPVKEIAQAAVKRLLEGEDQRAVGHESFSSTLVVRDSCGLHHK